MLMCKGDNNTTETTAETMILRIPCLDMVIANSRIRLCASPAGNLVSFSGHRSNTIVSSSHPLYRRALYNTIGARVFIPLHAHGSKARQDFTNTGINEVVERYCCVLLEMVYKPLKIVFQHKKS